MTTMPVRLDRLQAGLKAWLQAVHPSASVIWDMSEISEDALASLVLLVRMLTGPSSAPDGGDSVRMLDLPMTATLQVLLATAGEGIRLHASGRSWEYTIQAGDDVEAVRDGLLAVVDADPTMVDAVFSAGGVDSIEIEATELGDLWGVDLTQSVAGLASLTIDDSTEAEAQIGETQSLVEIQAFSPNRYPRSGATAALSKILATSRLKSAQGILDAHGLSIADPAPTIVNLDAISGSQSESRAAMSFIVVQTAIAAEEQDTIDTITFTTETLEPAESSTVEVSP